MVDRIDKFPKTKMFYGKEYIRQFERDMPEKEANAFVKQYDKLMKLKLVRSDFFLNGAYYFIYARSRARDTQNKGKFGGVVLKHVTTKTKRVKDQVVRVTKGLSSAGKDTWNTLKEEPVDLGYYSKKKGRK